MISLDPVRLIRRLDDGGRTVLEAAIGLTVSRTHHNVELEHLLCALLRRDGDEVAVMLSRAAIDRGRVEAELDRALDRLPRGSARTPGLAPAVVDAIRQAWLLASVEQASARARPGHLLWAMLADDVLGRLVRGAAPSLGGVSVEGVAAVMAAVPAEAADPAGQVSAGQAPAGGTALARFTTDLTAQAREGKMDPVLGRDDEIRQITDILLRRRQNNPILTGEAGVGKTAVVEGFAQRLASGEVPPALQGVVLRVLDLGALEAGAGVKGEFENRLRGVIDEVRASPVPIVLFVDEAHNLIGAGGQAGQGDAANLLKPALARGDLRMIAATTWAEYKKYFERDAALTRRFQVVKVAEPAEATAIAMLRGLMAKLEKHHGVRVLEEALEASVKLSARFIPSRQLPDKAVSLLDTACARVAMSQAGEPAPLEACRRRLALNETETEILARETREGLDHAERLEALEKERKADQAELAALTARWDREKALVQQIDAARAALATGEDGSLPALAEAGSHLRAEQRETPLVFPEVDGQAVAEIVQAWTGIPAGRMRGDEIESVLHLQDRLGERIIGQDHAIEAVARAIRTSRARMTDPRKPVGVFLMVGTSGVGKTETAMVLADLLYGGAQNLTVLNMSEFKEEHKVSLLMGSPPGYVGYGEGGVLTEAVRRRPYSVILLDEMEKAHPGVQDVFYQVFDKGWMKDGEGRDIDFRNTLIVMTSNAGSSVIERLFADPSTAPDAAALGEALRPELLRTFRPAFLGRVSLVPYLPLPDDAIRRIALLQLGRVAARLREAWGAELTWDAELPEILVSRCTESASGARALEGLLARGVLPDLSAAILARLARGERITSARITVGPGGVLLCSADDPVPVPA